MNILVVDVGTSSMRGILFSREGCQLAQKQCTYKVSYMSNGWAEQDPSDWKEALHEIVSGIMKEVHAKKWSLDAVVVTAQRSSVFPADSSMEPLGKAIMWQDRRTDQICERIGRDNDRVFSLSGARVNPVFSGSKMAWIKENCPAVYKKTYKFLIVSEYVLYLMTGELYTDHTYGSRSHLMNIREKKWDPELLELFGVDESKLNRLIEPGSICGKVKREFAALTGCPEGIPVITAGGDQQCGAVGQGIIAEGMASVTAGTGGFLIALTDKVPENLKQDVICNCSSLPGKYILESNILTCCSAFDWFRREFLDNCSYEEAAELLEQVPAGSNGCLCIPYFQGRSTPDWNYMAKGVFANITLATTKADMLKSMLEGICYEIQNGVETIQKYMDVSDICMNGGLTNSVFFNQMQCNVLGRRIVRKGDSEATAKGALIIALKALGLYSTIRDAYVSVSEQEKVTEYFPELNDTILYKECRAEMNELYRKMQ